MVDRHPVRRGLTRLRGRRTECMALERMIEAVREGESRALVVRGEAGVGKTALLEHLVDAVSGFRVVRTLGVESEMELAFAALHQLCVPMLDRLRGLPAPQRAALEIVFGLSAGPPPDRFLVGLAVLSLLSEVAEERPLLCLVDDTQWLDRASAQTLAFVARRLSAESVAVLFAAREIVDEFRGLPEIEVHGLRSGDARALLGSAVGFLLDERVRDLIVAETRGNPLALVELPRGLTVTQLAGGFGLLGGQALSGRIEDSFLRRLDGLPDEARLFLLVASAESVGDPLLVWRAAERLGIAVSASGAAETEGLVAIGERVMFRHPLVRSAVYRSASMQERRAVHSALAEVTDPELDPDRRAWHLAAAAPGPDEEVASELFRSAGRAQARGGLSAAAAFLQRSVALTLEPARRSDRALAAAHANLQAGALDAVSGLLATAEAGPLDELQCARVDLLRAELAFVSRRGRDAPPLLLKAAARLEHLDVGLARETYLDALSAAMFSGRLADPECGVLEVSRAALAAPRAPNSHRAPDLLLDGLAALFSEGYAVAVPILQRALRAFGVDMSAAEELRWLWLACVSAIQLWDDERWEALSNRHVQLAREAGALSELPLALSSRIYMHLFAGRLTSAGSMIEEVRAATEATGGDLTPYGALGLAALHGRETDALPLIEASSDDVVERGEGIGVSVTEWTKAVLYNGLGRYEQALTAARLVSEYPEDLGTTSWGMAELIEAAVRGGKPEMAADTHRRLIEMTRASGTNWALGIEARCSALLAQPGTAEGLYREAVERLARTGLRMELARAHLLYGEWLRRENRRVDARQQLRAAHDMLAEMGARAFAERARAELLATGEKVRKRTVETRDQLTAQERQIALLARDGLSNAEIGTRLFISSRTVEWHLRKVFAKLGISSRRSLHNALASQPGNLRARHDSVG